MDKVVLSAASKDASGQINSDAESGPKDKGTGTSVAGFLPGAFQGPADPAASALISAMNQDLMKANPGAAEQVVKQEQNAAGGSMSITDLQSINLLTMNPDLLLTAIRQNQYPQAPAKGTKVDAIV
jgi:hypothetical protein